MPVTNVGSRWSSGDLIFYEKHVSLASIANILTIGDDAITVGSATQDIDFKIFMGASDTYALFDCGNKAITFAKVDVALSGDLTVTVEDISLAVGKYLYLDGQDGNDYLRASTDNNVILNGETTVILGVAGTAVITAAAAAVTIAQETTISDATASSSTGTGCLILGGGLGVAEDIYIGGDFYLPTGKKIDFNGGDVTITHASNLLTVAGGNLRMGTTDRIEFRDATEYIYSSTDGQVDIVAATTVALSGAVTANSSITATGAVLPTVSGTPALGSATLMWADLFLASGGVINFNNGDVTVTHGSGSLTVVAATKINLDGPTDITGALRLDSNTIANGAAFTVGTSGTPLDYTATSASSSGMQIHLTSDYAGTASSMKGADIRTTATGGTTGSLLGIQTVVVRSSGNALTKEIWGLNGVVQLTGGQAASMYGLVGDITVAAGTKVGTDGSASYLTAGLFRTDVESTVDFANVGITAPVIAVLVGNNTNGATKLKADGAVVAVIGGDSATTTAGAAFKVIRLNSIAASEFDYGLDLYSAATGYTVNDFATAEVRLSTGAYIMSGSGAPGATAPEGSVYFRTDLTGGSAGSAVYLNTDGATNWVALT